ncbi:MAG TPA: hypothetical protein VMG31_14475 [Verrucomicrobiae bacterium]|nr:hypothetical protein [Verrucomicrobiae bacterium]
MKNRHRLAKLAIPVALCLVASIALVKRSSATIGNVNKGDLAGPWQVTLYGQGGCGVGTVQVNFTLNSSGVSTAATSRAHNVGCGDYTTTGNTFTITSMTFNGSGTASLTCGSGCGFTFDIQVAPDRSSFNLVDLTDPGNFLEGVAIHQ